MVSTAVCLQPRDRCLKGSYGIRNSTCACAARAFWTRAVCTHSTHKSTHLFLARCIHTILNTEFCSLSLSFYRYHPSVAHPALKIQEELKTQELLSSCVCHVTFMPRPLAPCDDVMMYSLQLTSCTALPPPPHTHSFSPCESFTTPENVLSKEMWVSRRNAIHILCPIKPFPFTRSKSLCSDLPFTIQALPIITSYPVVYNTNLGYPVTQLKEGWFCQTGLM